MKDMKESKDEKAKKTKDIVPAEKVLSTIKHEKSHKKTWIKPVMITVFSAILIGSVLGFVMLNMFTNLGASVTDDPEEPVRVNADQLDDKENQVSLVSLEGLSAYVMQGGVFSEIANADKWAIKYEEAGFSSVVFERDEQYFLFVGIAPTEKQADQLATTLEDKQFEVYVKNWQTDQVELELTAEEEHWLLAFQDEWEETLQLVSVNEDVLIDDWNELVNSYPSESKLITELIEQIGENDLEELTHAEWQGMLLSVWKDYEKILSSVE